MMTTVSRWSKAALLGGCGLVGVALVVTIAYPSSLSALVHAPERFYTRWFPPPSPPQLPGVSARERAAWRELGSQVSGRIVWSSNRDGNHDLFLVDLTSGAEQRLTDSPHVDFFSRFSPDGTSISFLRSQEPWVSFRDESAWDLYLINADGSGERRLVAGAYHPTWLPDGSGLVYVFENRIYRFDLASGRAEVLHDGRDAPTEGRVHEPELLDDGILAITLRNVPQETVGVLDQQAGVYRPLSSQRACQITWFPGLRRAVWIDPRGNGGTQVMMADLDDAIERTLIDLPGDYSHEYFPRITANGEWLIWGAAAEGHEHDRADYEIFVWRIDTPWTSAIRLTHSPANDQWPDLFIPATL